MSHCPVVFSFKAIINSGVDIMRTDLVDPKFEHLFKLTLTFQKAVTSEIANTLNTALAAVHLQLQERPLHCTDVELRDDVLDIDTSMSVYEEPENKYDLKISKILFAEFRLDVQKAVGTLSNSDASSSKYKRYFKNPDQSKNIKMTNYSKISVPSVGWHCMNNKPYWDDLTKDAIAYFVIPEYV
jgi:hypothetical protein